MRLRQASWGVAVALLAVILPSCGEPSSDEGQNEAAADTTTVQVFVSVPPQAWLAERVGGPQVKVAALIDAKQDPHAFSATPRQIAELSQARIFFAVGLPMEKQLTAKLPDGVRVVDVGTRLATLSEPEGEHHHEGEEHAADGDMDPHVWLSVRNLIVMAEAMRDELSRADPARTIGYETRCTAVVRELKALDAKLAKTLAPFKGQRFYVYHPAFGYFARDYGLVQKAVEVDGKSPSNKQLTALIEQAKADGVKIVFVQNQFAGQAAKALAEALDGSVVPLDPMARDVMASFETMAARIAGSLKTN
jgi:zinc transport system substrate-binding protein